MKFRNFSEIVFVLVLLPDHGYSCGGDIFAPQFYQTMNTLHTFAVEGAKCHFSFYIEKFRKITSAAVWAKGFKFRKLGCHVFWPGIPGTFSGKQGRRQFCKIVSKLTWLLCVVPIQHNFFHMVIMGLVSCSNNYFRDTGTIITEKNQW